MQWFGRWTNQCLGAKLGAKGRKIITKAGRIPANIFHDDDDDDDDDIDDDDDDDDIDDDDNYDDTLYQWFSIYCPIDKPQKFRNLFWVNVPS